MVNNHDEAPFVFLDTTVQIDRIIGDQAQRDSIRNNLQDRRVSTSGHVLGEFNKTLMQDAVTFRDLLFSSPNVEQALHRLPSYARRFPRTVYLLARLGFDNDKENTLNRLEKFIDFQAYDQFWESIDRSDWTDEVGCVLKDWVPKQNESGGYDITGLRCLKKRPPPCSVQDFIEENRSTIGDFIVASKNNPRENVDKAGQALQAIISGLDVPFGERGNCYRIADTLIVFESRQDSEVYSTDGDIRAICELLGREMYAET